MSKAKLINFELLYLNDTEYTEQQLTSVNFKIVTEEIKKAAAEGCDTIFGLMLLDGFLYKVNESFFEWMRSVESFSRHHGIDKIILVPGMCEDYESVLRENGIDADIVFFDFTHRMVYNSYRTKLNQLSEWDPTNLNFLFLGGIPSRVNRIRLLYKFYQNGLLNFCNWSFFKPITDHDAQICRSLIPEFSDTEFEKFLNLCERSIDVFYKDAQEYSRLSGSMLLEKNIYSKPWLKDPAWIDPSVFKNTKFSVISEGNAYPPATSYRFLTEKTWRTIVNRHPFILAGNSEQAVYANDRGIITFNQYFTDNFYLLENEEDRLDQITVNAKCWLDYMDIKSINADVERNYSMFFSIAESQEEWFRSLVAHYQIRNDDIDQWFNQQGFGHLIRIPNGN